MRVLGGCLLVKENHLHGTIEGPSPRTLTGRSVLLSLAAFFAVVTGVNVAMIVAAVTTFGGVETESAYQAGLAFPAESAAAVAQDALHWRVTVKISREPDATLIEVSAVDATGRGLTGLEATARLVHPADRRVDHNVPLREAGPGEFRGRSVSAVGQWALVLELSRAGTPVFRSKNRVVLR
jgi:nitrogen fixation protein FixH